MNPFRLVSFLAIAALAVACSSSPKKESLPDDPAGSDTAEAPGAGDDDTSVGSDGSADDSVGSEPGGGEADGCANEIAIRCKGPFVDGCSVAHPTDATRKLTTDHRCVSAEPSGTPCEQEVALVCGDSAQDSCLFDPPLGDVHFCAAK